MKKFIFSRVMTYLSFIALFLVTLMSIHTMLALVLSLLFGFEGETTFVSEFSHLYHSGLIMLSFIATVGTFIGVALEYAERKDKMREYYTKNLL